MKHDPLALAFFGAALALLAALLLYVFVFKKPEPAPPAGAPGTLEALRSRAQSAVDQLREKAAPAPAPVPKPAAPPVSAAKPAPKTARAAAALPALQPGRTWRYAVAVQPEVWRDATLTYRTQAEGTGIGVLTEFVHAGGKMNFHLGTFSAGHQSHPNTRFPGFFMYAAYLQPPLEVGQPVAFHWQWQGGGGAGGRLKQFEGKVVAWEDLQLPAGRFRAAKIEGTLRYMQALTERARVHEVFWYAPQVAQVVKIRREGKAPDENLTLIVAELAEYR